MIERTIWAAEFPSSIFKASAAATRERSSQKMLLAALYALRKRANERGSSRPSSQREFRASSCPEKPLSFESAMLKRLRKLCEPYSCFPVCICVCEKADPSIIQQTAQTGLGSYRRGWIWYDFFAAAATDSIKNHLSHQILHCSQYSVLRYATQVPGIICILNLPIKFWWHQFQRPFACGTYIPNQKFDSINILVLRDKKISWINHPYQRWQENLVCIIIMPKSY